MEPMATRVEPTENEDIQLLFHSQDVYEMTSPRGRVLILHNDEFDTPANADQELLHDRLGSEADRDELIKVFEELDFKVAVHENASSKDMLTIIKNETRNEKHGEYGMFVLVILSHGKENAVFGEDARPVPYRDIYKKLGYKNFPAMNGKPKWVIIQACSGNEKDLILTDNASSQNSSLQDETSPMSNIRTDVTDFFILQSSFPGYVSARHALKGTFMIQSLIEVLRKHACHENLQDIVVRVRRAVLLLCKKYPEGKLLQTVFSSESLLKKIYLFPGLTPERASDIIRSAREKRQSQASRRSLKSIHSSDSVVSLDSARMTDPLLQAQAMAAGDSTQPPLDIGKAPSPSFSFKNFSVEDHVIFAYSEAHQQYLTVTTGQTACFLDSSCAEQMGFQIPTNGATPEFLLLAGVIKEKQYIQAKKDGNRFNVKIGTKVHRVKAKRILLPHEFHAGDRVFLFKPKAGGPVYVVGEPPYQYFLDPECQTHLSMVENDFCPGSFCQAQITEIRPHGNSDDRTGKRKTHYSVKCEPIPLQVVREFGTVTLPPQTL